MSHRTPTESPKESLLRVRHWSIVAKLGALTGLVAAVFTIITQADKIIDIIFPPSLPPVIEISNLRLTDDLVSLNAFLAEHYDLESSAVPDLEQMRNALRASGVANDVIDELTEGALSTSGFVVTFTTHMEGLQGTCLPIEWSLESLDPKRALSEGDWSNQKALPYPCVKPDREIEDAELQTWIPIPGQSGPFKVTIAMFDDTEESRRVALEITTPLVVLSPVPDEEESI
jgi:hypothetical protein